MDFLMFLAWMLVIGLFWYLIFWKGMSLTEKNSVDHFLVIVLLWWLIIPFATHEAMQKIRRNKRNSRNYKKRNNVNER